MISVKEDFSFFVLPPQHRNLNLSSLTLRLDDIITELQSLNAVDFSTETTLDSINTRLQYSSGKWATWWLEQIYNQVYGNSTNLNQIEGLLELVDGASVNDWLKSIDGELTTIRNNTEERDGSSIADWLKSIDDELVLIKGHVDGLEGKLDTIAGHVDDINNPLNAKALIELAHLAAIENDTNSINDRVFHDGKDVAEYCHDIDDKLDHSTFRTTWEYHRKVVCTAGGTFTLTLTIPAGQKLKDIWGMIQIVTLNDSCTFTIEHQDSNSYFMRRILTHVETGTVNLHWPSWNDNAEADNESGMPKLALSAGHKIVITCSDLDNNDDIRFACGADARNISDVTSTSGGTGTFTETETVNDMVE